MPSLADLAARREALEARLRSLGEKTEPSARETERSTVPSGTDLVTRRYSEEDIAFLERQDLTDWKVSVALLTAYEQNDPHYTPGLEPNTTEYAMGTRKALKARVARAEAQLAKTPQRYDARVRRMKALCGLARIKKHQNSTK